MIVQWGQWVQRRRGQKAHAVAVRRFDANVWIAHCGISGVGGVINGGDAKCQRCLKIEKLKNL